MAGKQIRSYLLGVLGIIALLAGADPGWQHGYAKSRLLDFMPPTVRAFFRPAPSGRKEPTSPPKKCGGTIDPNGCPPPPSCMGCGG